MDGWLLALLILLALPVAWVAGIALKNVGLRLMFRLFVFLDEKTAYEPWGWKRWLIIFLLNALIVLSPFALAWLIWKLL